MGVSIEKNSNNVENEFSSFEEVEVISYTYDNYTKVVNPNDKSEDLYFKSVLIYSSEKVDDNTFKTYYSPKGQYVDISNSTLNKREVTFTDMNDIDRETNNLLKFKKYAQLYEKKPTMYNFIKLHKAYNKYLENTTSITVLVGDTLILDPEDDIVKEFYKLENISNTLSFSLPYLVAKDQIENAIDEITSYLANGEMDMGVINSSIEGLQQCEFCESSLQLLQQVSSGENLDYRYILDKLNSYAHNIGEIIKINTKNSEIIEEL